LTTCSPFSDHDIGLEVYVNLVTISQTAYELQPRNLEPFKHSNNRIAVRGQLQGECRWFASRTWMKSGVNDKNPRSGCFNRPIKDQRARWRQSSYIVN
jgi:hypothetical protein